VEFVHREGGRPVALPQVMGPGVAFRDLDGDGLADLVWVQGAGDHELTPGPPPRFRYFRNLGDGTFADATAPSGLDVAGWGMGVLAADLDNDGRPDLVFTFYGRSPAAFRNQGDGTFRPWALPPEVRPDPFGSGLCAVDARGIGLLDVLALSYVDFSHDDLIAAGSTKAGVEIRGKWQPRLLSPFLPNPRPALFFQNRGDLTFRECAGEVGAANARGKGLAAAVLPAESGSDVFVANDVTPCALLHDDGGRYEDVAVAAWVAEVAGSMGLALTDYDHDGEIDVFCSRWIQETHALYRANRRRDGARYFTNVAEVTGLADLGTTHVGWGCGWLDVNGDGWEDLVVVQGHTFVDDSHERLVAQPPLVLVSERGQRFVRAAAPAGSVLATPLVARGAAFADYDNDGAVDVAVAQNNGPGRLWHAERPPGHWLAVELCGTHGSRDAVGAVVHVDAGDLKLTHPATSGDSYLSASSARLTFRIAGETRPRVRVRWRSGRTQEVGEVPPDRIVRVVEE